MSGERLLRVRQRQLALLERSAGLRAGLATQAQGLEPTLLWVSRLHEGWLWLRGHPEWSAGAALTLLVLRPRRSLSWGLRLWSIWRVVQRVKRFQGL